jgi:hypothetical protein
MVFMDRMAGSQEVVALLHTDGGRDGATRIYGPVIIDLPPKQKGDNLGLRQILKWFSYKKGSASQLCGSGFGKKNYVDPTQSFLHNIYCMSNSCF